MLARVPKELEAPQASIFPSRQPRLKHSAGSIHGPAFRRSFPFSRVRLDPDLYGPLLKLSAGIVGQGPTNGVVWGSVFASERVARGMASAEDANIMSSAPPLSLQLVRKPQSSA